MIVLFFGCTYSNKHNTKILEFLLSYQPQSYDILKNCKNKDTFNYIFDDQIEDILEEGCKKSENVNRYYDRTAGM